MSASVNKVIIVGTLGADPELKTLDSGASVCELRVATNESWNDKQGQRQERTEWHSVQVWGKTAENCAQYLEKGRSVYVEGSLQTRSWDGADGNKRYKTEIRGERVQFLGGGSRTESESEAPKASSGRRPRGRGVPRGDWK